MGRGRAKAKQTKVARKLKYYSPDTDLNALERELGGVSHDAADDDLDPDQGDAGADSGPPDEDDYGGWASGEH